MELLLIRHGLPVRIENTDGQPADPPLSDAGREQAHSLARWLEPERIDVLYASPLKRALETAAPLADTKGLEIVIEPGVVELDRDSPFYVPLEELKQTDYERWREAVQRGLYAGIDVEGFQRTVVESIERIVAAHPGGRVAVVCHGGVINSWVGHILGIEDPLFFDPTYTSINRCLAARTGERMVVSLNEAAHVRELATP